MRISIALLFSAMLAAQATMAATVNGSPAASSKPLQPLAQAERAPAPTRPVLFTNRQAALSARRNRLVQDLGIVGAIF